MLSLPPGDHAGYGMELVMSNAVIHLLTLVVVLEIVRTILGR